MKILIVEDEPKLLKPLVRIFELNNYVVDGVLNGKSSRRKNNRIQNNFS